MKSKENIEKKGLRRLSDEELKEVTGGGFRIPGGPRRACSLTAQAGINAVSPNSEPLKGGYPELEECEYQGVEY